MKKLLAILLGAIFVLSFAASAFAIHAEIPAETQAVVAKKDIQISIDGELRTRGWYQKNIFNADPAKTTGAPANSNHEAWYDERIRLAFDAKVGNNEAYLQLESGSGDNDLYTWGNFGSKPTTLSVLQAWMLHKGTGLLGIPAGLKIGHMPLALGEKQFFDHTKFGDDAIVFFMDPTKEMHVGLLTIKFAENNKTVNSDDLDGYVGLMTYKWDAKNTIGINYTFLNKSNTRFSHQDLGLHASGNLAGLGYRSELDIQFGKMSETVKARGWAFLLGLNYNVDPATLRASFGYGSGDKGETADKNEMFSPYLDNNQHYTLVYEYRVNSTAGGVNSGLANTTYYNLGVDFAPTKDVKASIDGYILRASKVASGSKSAGWELDGKVVYNVAKNLTYQVDAGYFKSGKFYSEEKKGATVLRHAITLSF